MQQVLLMYAVHAEGRKLTAKEGQMPFIHVARAQSSNTLGPQTSCTPPDRDTVEYAVRQACILYTYEVQDAWDVWDAWDAWDGWDTMLGMFMLYGMQYEGQQVCVYTGCTK